ncbi:DUF3168 domain-containing protein [Leisingera sp. ANG-M6]|uniref:DUF3168 domain-containing protein n=1 Tax=Leisingera sp. ANG-M6 TaxID=1577900 RepID=UPI00057ECBB3|nr:DUF3168 domain-containing protein [Leisingera sp. ANG-M6]KIC30055.1 hypothetical protein RA24_03685 [Leisingera sp. ANG-M6]
MEYDLIGALEPLGHAVVWGGFEDAEGFPRITLQRVGSATGYTLKGRVKNETARVQVNVYAENYESMLLTARQVTETLTSFRGGSVIRCREVSRQDGKTGTGGDEIRLQMLDFRVRYRA